MEIRETSRARTNSKGDLEHRTNKKSQIGKDKTKIKIWELGHGFILIESFF